MLSSTISTFQSVIILHRQTPRLEQNASKAAARVPRLSSRASRTNGTAASGYVRSRKGSVPAPKGPHLQFHNIHFASSAVAVHFWTRRLVSGTLGVKKGNGRLFASGGTPKSTT